MAYIKDPKTGKYIQTGGTAPVKSVAPVQVPAPASAPVKYGKDASGKYVTTPSDTPRFAAAEYRGEPRDREE
jgi:hypothetical protein